MRRKEKEIIDYNDIENIISNADICRIAIIDEDKPYIIPMSFGYKNRCLYFHSASSGRKIDCLRKKPDICFEIETDCELVRGEKVCSYGMRFRTVIGWGKAVFIDELQEKNDALELIVERYSEKAFKFEEKALQATLVFKVEIDEVTGKQSGF